MTALLEFECRPSIGGYRIVTLDQRKFVDTEFDFETGDYLGSPPPDATEDERHLLERWGMRVTPMGDEPEVLEVLVPQSERTQRFDLFESDTAVFLQFADTPITLEGIKAFADRFGPLHGGKHPEFVNNWYWSIKEMRRAVTAWEKANATGNFNPVVRLAGRHGELQGLGGGGGVNVLLKKDPLTDVPRLCLLPEDLLDALWIQLTLAIDGSQNLRTCAECRTWFTIEVGRGRSDKEYCSNACRMRAYRTRKGAVR